MAESDRSSYNNKLKEIEKVLKDEEKLGKKLKETTDEELAEKRKKLLEDYIEYEKKLRSEIQEEEHRIEIQNLKEEGKILEAFKKEYFDDLSTGISTIAGVADGITKKLDGTIENYINNLQALSAGIIGTGRSAEDISEKLLNALTGQGFVQTQSVFNNLNKLISAGITDNVEQRAFLQTLSDDMNLMFNSTNGSLLQLIRIQQADLTSNRMAIQYNLQEFLNQNYGTAEYIKETFSSVSDSLVQMQSLMSSNQAIGAEAAIQSWLGSYYSAGMSGGTVNNLAQAINALGSGDISNLGQGISNLVLMGVARAGLDYSDILNNGLSPENINLLMGGITGYMGDMWDNDSNVVRSQLSKIFGVNVADLRAINNVNPGNTVTDDISRLLSGYQENVPFTVAVNNLLKNFMYGWGTNIASNPLGYGSYEVEKLISNTLGDALSGVNTNISLFGNGVSLNLGALAKATPIITLLPTLIETVGNVFNSSTTSLAGVFNQLYDSGSNLRVSGSGVSGSMYMGAANTTDILDNSKSSVSDIAGVDIAGDQESQEQIITNIRDKNNEIYDLLDQKLSTIDSTLSDIMISIDNMSGGM